MKVTFTVDLLADDRWEGVSVDRRLACALEAIYRDYGFRCTATERRMWGPDTDTSKNLGVSSESVQGRSSSPFHLHKGSPTDGGKAPGDPE